MSLFGFGDITFGSPVGGAKGPFAPLVNSEFSGDSYRYPIDLGNYDKAHYMVFYIKEQKNSSYRQNAGLNDSLIDELSTGETSAGASLINSIPSKQAIAGGLLTAFNNTIGNAVNSYVSKTVGSAVNIFGNKSNVLGGTNQATQTLIDTSVRKITGGSLGPSFRTTQLTRDSIALYMPDTLMYAQTQSYDQLNLGNELTGQVAAAGKSALDALEAGGSEQGFSALKKSALRAILQEVEKRSGNQTVRGAIAAVTGEVVNPMIEMVYRSPNFRTFQFDFMFYPRDEKEAYQVQSIIRKMEFHQAPEVNKVKQGFLIPPSEFEIRFYYAGKQNPNIPPIASCVLTNIQANYAPNGFSAFEVPNENFPALGRTGMPVAIQLTLSFQETTFLTKSDYLPKPTLDVEAIYE